MGKINEICFKIIPAHQEEDMPQISEMWEQVRVFIDGEDIINKIDFDDDFHWGVDSSFFLTQKNNYFGGKLLIGICGCTAEGCDDIIVDVDKSENYIIWKIYHERNDDINAVFVFDIGNYQNALIEAKSKITQKEEDVCN